MPAIIPFIPLIVAAAGATTAGLTLAGVGQPDTGAAMAQQQKQLNDAKMRQAQQDALAKQKAIQGNLANAQEQGGGALNAPSLTELAATIAGLPGEAGGPSGTNALSAYLGTPAAGLSPSGGGGTGTPSGASGGPGGGSSLSDLLTHLLSSSKGSGGGNMVGETYGLSGSMG